MNTDQIAAEAEQAFDKITFNEYNTREDGIAIIKSAIEKAYNTGYAKGCHDTPPLGSDSLTGAKVTTNQEAFMTPEAQRIAIAEACGWRACRTPLQSKSDPTNDGWQKGSRYIRILPDYLNDLNDMHEAEKVLTDEQTDDYARKLLVKVARQRTNYVWHANAAQRAEAFLRTLGLWKDD